MIGTWLRTARALHPLHVLARPPVMIARRVLRSVPSGAAPALRDGWPSAPDGIRRFAESERERALDRIARLPQGSALRAYEEQYGLDLGADGAPRAWTSPVAVAPFPASVRARRIAVATWLGRRDLGAELARAARAIAVQPEVHLLGNHLLENGFGLACAGAAATGVEADAWWRAGSAILSWQLPRQFLADGGHFERSASYHLALTAALLETIAIAGAAERRVPDAWRRIAARAVGWAIAVRAPDRTYPLFNDAALDAAPTIDRVSALARALGAPPLVPPELDATGWLRMASPDGAWLVVDVAPDGPRDQPGHAHADGLTFELWVNGERAIVDYGVSSYANDDARKTTRATRSHNTLELEGRDSCEVWGAFRLGRRGTGRVVSRTRTTAELSHDGYAWLPGAPVHRRAIALTERRLEIVDTVHGAAGQPVVSRLRVDRACASRLRVTGGEARDGEWFPRHGESRPAVVFEACGLAGDPRGVRWVVEW